MIVDIIVLVVLLVSAVIAFLRGFIRETLTILGVGGGALASYLGGPHLIPYMRGWIGEEGSLFGIIPYTLLSDILSYASIFVVVVILLSVLSHILAETARNIGLGAVDRTLGVMFGLARAVLILAVIYMPFSAMNKESKESFFAGSQTHMYIEAASNWLMGYMPPTGLGEENADETLSAEEETGLSEARKRLEEMDILSREQVEKALNSESMKGYSEEFRNKMDALIEEKLREQFAPQEEAQEPEYNE